MAELQTSEMCEEPLPPLPGVAGELEEVIGRRAVIRLINNMRGTTGRSWRVCFYVPKALPMDHDLVDILGWHKARLLSKAFGGEILQTSNLRTIERDWRNRSLGFLLNEAVARMDVPEIAEFEGLSVYRVREILRGKPPEARRRGEKVNSTRRVA
ncbi:hypothetical protein [Roseovarius sp. D0-M9]|uniref:hypothetical protein n=1 Tax=Roseovarius sp. D0-M9 TaxID=3127117 RepID=UPI0030105938